MEDGFQLNISLSLIMKLIMVFGCSIKSIAEKASRELP